MTWVIQSTTTLQSITSLKKTSPMDPKHPNKVSTNVPAIPACGKRWKCGRTIKRSGLRDTGGISLVSVMRRATRNVHTAVSPEFVLEIDDILYFTGLIDAFGDFCEEHGLEGNILVYRFGFTLYTLMLFLSYSDNK